MSHKTSKALLALLIVATLLVGCVQSPPKAPVEIKHQLTVSADGNGTVTPAIGTHAYTKGSVVSLEAKPAEGHQFVRWEGSKSFEQAAVKVTMDSDISLKAVFAPKAVVAPPPVVTPPPQTPSPLMATATMSDATPKQNSTIMAIVTVTRDGKPVQGADVNIRCLYKSTTTPYSGVTGADGVANISFKIGRASLDYKVNVEVTAKHDGQTATTVTSFTPKN